MRISHRCVVGTPGGASMALMNQGLTAPRRRMGATGDAGAAAGGVTGPPDGPRPGSRGYRGMSLGGRGAAEQDAWYAPRGGARDLRRCRRGAARGGRVEGE